MYAVTVFWDNNIRIYIFIFLMALFLAFGYSCREDDNGGLGPAPAVDTDKDGIADNMDNCPAAANADQIDADKDGRGDICDDNDDTKGKTPTYMLSVSGEIVSIAEGSSVEVVLMTANIPDGTNIPYTLSTEEIEAADIVHPEDLAGSFIVEEDFASVVIEAAEDLIVDEGIENFNVELEVPPPLVLSPPVSIGIEDKTPTYMLSVSGGSSSIDEGSSVEVVLMTTNIPDGTNIPYTLSTEEIEAADIVRPDGLTGFFTVEESRAIVTIETAEDLILDEGTENFNVELDGVPPSLIHSPLSLGIEDRTIPYTLSASKRLLREDSGSVKITLSTIGIEDGEVFGYIISGEGIEASELELASLTGNFPALVGGKTSIEIHAVNDMVLEGNETLTITLNGHTDVSLSMRLADPLPTYELTTTKTSIEEGEDMELTLTTTNAPDTEYAYTILGGPVVQSADFSTGLYGVFNVISGTATKTLSILSDELPEGTESFIVILDDVYPAIQSGPIRIASNIETDIRITNAEDDFSPSSLGYPNIVPPLPEEERLNLVEVLNYTDFPDILKTRLKCPDVLASDGALPTSFRIDRITINQTVEVEHSLSDTDIKLINKKPGILRVYLDTDEEHCQFFYGTAKLSGGGTISGVYSVIQTRQIDSKTPYSMNQPNPWVLSFDLRHVAEDWFKTGAQFIVELSQGSSLDAEHPSYRKLEANNFEFVDEVPITVQLVNIRYNNDDTSMLSPEETEEAREKISSYLNAMYPNNSIWVKEKGIPLQYHKKHRPYLLF